jgi:selenocysteine lyase/cysteine desulfurase
MNLIDISKKIKSELLFEEPYITTPFHNKIKVTYADCVATNRPSPIVEKYINNNIYPYYSNTHSNADCATIIKKHIDKTKQYIRRTMNLNKSKQVIFTGNGTTGAINHLVNSLNYSSYSIVNILLSTYEHHSNYLPWVELSKNNKLKTKINIHIVPIIKSGDIDLHWIDIFLNNNNNTNTLNITSITACSNVTGIITDIKKINFYVKKYNNNNIINNLLFVDYACSAPYVKIDASLTNACFMSPHKFIGGVSTPGILIADDFLFMKDNPYAPGGGCVQMANQHVIKYSQDLEKRESGGTPNIIGIIRIKPLLIIKDNFIDIIEKNEHIITQYVHTALQHIVKKGIAHIIFSNKCVNNRLPIICITVEGCHYNLFVKLLNDIFGIQTRGGISCCGMFAKYMEDVFKINGWCRISFNWTMNKNELDYIINAIIYVSVNYKKYEHMYIKDNNLYEFKGTSQELLKDNYLYSMINSFMHKM